MKKTISIIVLVLSVFQGIKSQEYPIDLEKAQQYFMEAKKLSDADGSKLWGMQFYGPMMFVDPSTRFIVTNKADLQGILKAEGDVFIGYLKAEDGIANTATEWAGETWMMIMWGAMSEDVLKRTNLMMHELYHCIQPKIGMSPQACNNKHLDQMQARIWMKLEWNALENAIFSAGEVRHQSVTDALKFRNFRHNLYPLAKENEVKLELNEGIAEYTGFKLALLNKKDQSNYFKTTIPARKNVKSYVRSFAYISGPLYGFLLDEKSGDWHKGITKNSDLGESLGKYYDLDHRSEDEDTLTILAQQYGYDSILSKESKREKQRLLKIKELEEKFVQNPVLKLNLTNMKIQFDPRSLQPLGNYGTVYQTIRVADDWGILDVDDEAIMSSDWKTITVSAVGVKHDKNQLQGIGWSLLLNEGWNLKCDGLNWVVEK